MKLPGRAYYNIWEQAARWGCTAADVIEWATLDHFTLQASIPQIEAQGMRTGGMMALNAQDLMPYFRRVGSGLEPFPVYRARPIDSDSWITAKTPPEISPLDVMISARDARAFEEENGLGPAKPAEPVSRHDWDGMWGFVVTRIFLHGIPDNCSALARECEEWFTRRDASTAPDISTILKKLRPTYRELVNQDT